MSLDVSPIHPNCCYYHYSMAKSFLEYISVKSLLIMWIFFLIETASPVWYHSMPRFCKMTKLDLLGQTYH